MKEEPIDAARRIKNQMDRRKKGGMLSVVFGIKSREIIAYTSSDSALTRYQEPDCDWRWIGRYTNDISTDALAEDIDAWLKEIGERL